MFGKKKTGTPQNSIDSLIGAGTRVEGNVVFTGGLRVDGEVRGNISSENPLEGTLVISEKASVEGAISVGHVVIKRHGYRPGFRRRIAGTPSFCPCHRGCRVPSD